MDMVIIITCSPYLITNAEPEPFMNGKHLVAASSKLMVIDKLLADILPKSERVLIFTVRNNLLLSVPSWLWLIDMSL